MTVMLKRAGICLLQVCSMLRSHQRGKSEAKEG
jgi:hypothetical protein